MSFIGAVGHKSCFIRTKCVLYWSSRPLVLFYKDKMCLVLEQYDISRVLY